MILPTPYFEDGTVTLFHGDCRDILPALADRSVDLVLMDPPYGHNNNNGDLAHRREAALGILPPEAPAPEARPIVGDGPEASDLVRFAFDQSARLLRDGSCCCCCCGGGGPDPQFARWSLWLDDVMDFVQMVVWDKGGLGMGWHYRRNYETVLVARKRGPGRMKWNGGNGTANVVRISGIKPSATGHPTPKPLGLMETFVRLHSDPGDLVLDPFAGAGTTLRAAKNLGRRAIGIEVDEQWCEMAARRLAQGSLLEVAT